MYVNYYCVCLIKFNIDGKPIQRLDAVTYPNPDKDPMGMVRCRQRATTLREMLSVQVDDPAYTTYKSLRDLLGVPDGAIVEIEPILLKQIPEHTKSKS